MKTKLNMLFPLESPTDGLLNSNVELEGQQRLISRVYWLTIALLVIIVILLLVAPILQPIYVFRAMKTNPETGAKELLNMVSMTEPNLTDGAVTSWATTSIVEVMTLGFGDFDKQIAAQRKRFTSQGWDSFQEAVSRTKMRDKFKSSQLILTTVPKDMPLVSARGDDKDGDFIWVIEMPVVMTFATNNEVTSRSSAIIQLHVTRVPSSDNSVGMGIKWWNIL